MVPLQREADHPPSMISMLNPLPLSAMYKTIPSSRMHTVSMNMICSQGPPRKARDHSQPSSHPRRLHPQPPKLPKRDCSQLKKPLTRAPKCQRTSRLPTSMRRHTREQARRTGVLSPTSNAVNSSSNTTGRLPTWM